MTPLRILPLFWLFFAFSPSTHATPPSSCAELGDNNGAEVFRKYANFTESNIHRICRAFDIKRIQGSVFEKTEKCLSSFEELRKLAKEQIWERENFCRLVEKAKACTDQSSQSSCLEQQATLQAALSENRQRLKSNAEAFNKILNEVETFHRAAKRHLNRDREVLEQGLANGTIFLNDLDTPALGTRSSEELPPPATQDASPPPSEVQRTNFNSRPKPPPSSVSGIDGNRTNSNGSTTPDSRVAGLQTLREYREKLPNLLNAVQQDVVVVEKETKIIHEVKAKFAAQAKQSLALAAKTLQFENLLASLPTDSKPETSSFYANSNQDRAKDPPIFKNSHNVFSSAQEIAPDDTDGIQNQDQSNRKNRQTTQAESAFSESHENLSDEAESQANGSFPFPGRKNHRMTKRHDMQSIRDQLKARLAKRITTDSTSGAWIAEVIQETNKLEHQQRALSTTNTARDWPLDVDSAVADINAQVREILATEGVLQEDSPSLFLRVKARIQLREHTLR